MKRTIMRTGLALLLAGAAVITGGNFNGATGANPFAALAARAKGKEEGKGQGRRCTERDAEGTYGFALVGSISGVGPVATSGTTTFDGEGKDSGRFTVTTFAGVQQFTFTGTYTVNADCTGAATLNISPAVFGYGVLHFDAVGVNNEREIKWLITDPGVVLAGTLTRQ